MCTAYSYMCIVIYHFSNQSGLTASNCYENVQLNVVVLKAMALYGPTNYEHAWAYRL